MAQDKEECPLPWFSATIIPPVPAIIPLGQVCLVNNLFVTTTTGSYDEDWHSVKEQNFYTTSPSWNLYIGLTPWCDLTITPQFLWNNTSNQNSFRYGDMIVGLDFQLLDPDYTPYFPGIKFSILEVFPTGHFEHLSASKLGTDISGFGTYGSQFSLQFYKVWRISPHHWMTGAFYALYQVNTATTVRGINAYGGDSGTKETVLPGDVIQAILSFEFSLTKHWALGLDNIWTHNNSSKFFGVTTEPVGGGSSEQLSFCPCIEYNFDCHLSLVAGCWFTALGRNSDMFRSGILTFNLQY